MTITTEGGRPIYIDEIKENLTPSRTPIDQFTVTENNLPQIEATLAALSQGETPSEMLKRLYDAAGEAGYVDSMSNLNLAGEIKFLINKAQILREAGIMTEAEQLALEQKVKDELAELNLQPDNSRNLFDQYMTVIGKIEAAQQKRNMRQTLQARGITNVSDEELTHEYHQAIENQPPTPSPKDSTPNT